MNSHLPKKRNNFPRHYVSGKIKVVMMKKLTEEQIKNSLDKLSGWKLKDGGISKEFLFPDFKEALAFVNEVGELAEKDSHHPDIHIFYNKVLLELSTHDADGITEKDISLAGKIDLI